MEHSVHTAYTVCIANFNKPFCLVSRVHEGTCVNLVDAGNLINILISDN